MEKILWHFFSCMKVLKKNDKTGPFSKLVQHRIIHFMLPDQIGTTIYIKNSKLSGLKETERFQDKEDLNISSVFAIETDKRNCC